MILRCLAAFALLAAALPARAETALPPAATALMPTRVIYPGETVSADAVEEVALRPAPSVTTPVATDVAQVDGKVARRTLVPGRLIPINALRQAWLVEQGSPVQAVFSAGSLTISAAVVPLQPGAVGDFIRLRNPDSGKVFSGTVMADGTVQVSGD